MKCEGSRRAGGDRAGLRDRAFVLVGILVLVFLLSMTAISLLYRLQAGRAASAAGAGLEQAYAAAISGVEEAMRMAGRARPGFLEWRDSRNAFFRRWVGGDGVDQWYFTVYSPSEDESVGSLRYGMTDEASRLNVNMVDAGALMAIPGMTVELAAGFTGAGTNGMVEAGGAPAVMSGPGGASSAGVRPRWRMLEELLSVRGMGVERLLGEDMNQNGRLDPEEDDGLERWPPDNKDGRLDLGLRRYLTVSSSEANVDEAGLRRVNLNDPRDAFPSAGYPSGLSNYVVALRTNRMVLRHPADLLEGRLRVRDAAGAEVELASGVGKEELAAVLGGLTTRAGGRVEGLVNVNTAPVPVLQGVAGVDQALAEAIVSARQAISPERRGSLAWLYQEGVVDAAKFREIAPGLTVRSSQFQFRVVGYSIPSGYYRVLEVMIDVGAGGPAIEWIRDLTRLGRPFPLEGGGAGSAGGGAALRGAGHG